MVQTRAQKKKRKDRSSRSDYNTSGGTPNIINSNSSNNNNNIIRTRAQKLNNFLDSLSNSNTPLPSQQFSDANDFNNTQNETSDPNYVPFVFNSTRNNATNSQTDQFLQQVQNSSVSAQTQNSISDSESDSDSDNSVTIIDDALNITPYAPARKKIC